MKSSKRWICFLFLVTGSALYAQSWANPANWDKIPEPKTTKDIVYFPADAPGYTPSAQLLNLYQNSALKPGEKAPVLVFLHGGGWTVGERPENYNSFRPWLLAGFSLVTVEYRMAHGPNGIAPAAVQDVGCVLAWVRQNAAKYNFDPERVVTSGNSAGGHLALLAAVLPKDNDIELPQCKDQARIVAVIDSAGPYNLVLPDSMKQSKLKKDIEGWMGPDPKPSLQEKEHKLSPSSYIRPGIPPVFQIHGDADLTVPYQESLDLKRDLDKAGVKNSMYTAVGGGHGKSTPQQTLDSKIDALRFVQSVGVFK